MGLVALWYWSKRHARQSRPGNSATGSFKVSQKRWLDQKTGLALIEAEGQSFLLAYTVGGGVSWQPVVRQPVEADPEPEDFERIMNEAEPVLMRFR